MADRPAILNAAQERGRGTLDAIQYLRGIAAMMVVYYHAFPQVARMGSPHGGPKWLSSGVDIFFVISGFVMVYSAARHPQRGALAFLRDRIVRIVPLYWALSFVMLLLLLFVPAAAQTSRFDPAHVLASFLFVPWMHPLQHHYWPMLTPGWTLNYEMFFYVIFAAALGIAGRRRGLVVAISCAVLAGLALSRTLLPTADGIAGVYTNSLVLEFGFGMLLGEMFLRAGNFVSHRWWVVIGLGSFGLAISGATRPLLTQGLSIGVPAAMVVLGALYVPLSLDGAAQKIARKLGDASYAIYLSHPLLMSALGQIWRKIVPAGPPGWAGFVLCAPLICAVAGILLHHLLEKPLGRLATRALGGKAPSKRRIVYVVAPSGQAGGGMGRVKDYILSFNEEPLKMLDFRPLVTRDGRGFAASILLTLQAVVAIWNARLNGTLALVHVNLGDRGSALRKGALTLLARACGAKVIVHLHAVELEAHWRKSRGLLRWAIGLPFRTASSNIVLGDRWRDWLIDDLGVKAERVDVLANGVPAPPYPGRNHLAERSFIRLLFLGNLLERKGVSDLIAALSALPAGLPAWRLTFAGGGDLARYRGVVEQAGLSDRIDFLGWVDGGQVQTLLGCADGLVLPSHQEGLPLVILEALAAGTPVLTTSAGAIAQFIEADRDALVVPAGDCEMLVDALVRLIGDASLRQEICNEGRAKYEKVFSLDAFRINMLKIYLNTL